MDLENMPLEELFQALKCDRHGLSSESAQERLSVFGHNKLEPKKETKIFKFLSFMCNQFSCLLEFAALMAIAYGHPDWQVFVGIIMLLLINSTMSFMAKNEAGNNVAAALIARLTPKATVLRDGRWIEADATILVPGDIIRIKRGDTIPEDARLLDGGSLEIDQSAFTGESLPLTKGPGDTIYSGSMCKQGESESVVIATGVHTFFAEATHLAETTNQRDHFKKAVIRIESFCIMWIALGMIIEIVVAFPIQKRVHQAGTDNLLVLLIGGTPIALPTVFAAAMAIGSRRLLQQGAIAKRMTAIVEMAGMDVLCSDNPGTLTLSKLSVEKSLVEIFSPMVDTDKVILMAARASRLENQDAIDAAIVGMLADSKQARAGIQEVHFLSYSPTDKRTTLTYIDALGEMHRVSKGAPEQILNLVHNREELEQRVHAVIEKFAARGLQSVAVAHQEVPDGKKESQGGDWEFIGIVPLFDPPRPDSAENIRMASNLGINVKLITRDPVAVGKETCRRIGMGTNMYPSSVLSEQHDGNSIAGLSLDELIEKADGFAGVIPVNKYEIVKRLQARKHICGMTSDGVSDVPVLKKADIGIAIAGATDAACSASDIVLTEPGLSVIVNAVLTSRTVFQRMKNYTISAVSITVQNVFGFMLLALVWKFDFPPIMVLIIAFVHGSTIMATSNDRVQPSHQPDTWKPGEIFITGIIFGGYLAMMMITFFWAAYKTNFFPSTFGVSSLQKKDNSDYLKLTAAVYLQVSTISQALIFVTRSRRWSFTDRPSLLLVASFVVSQLIATVIAVYAKWSFAAIEGIGWRWAGVVWLYNLLVYFLLDPIQFFIRDAPCGRAWDLELEQSTMNETGLNRLGEEAKLQAEIARLREIYTLKGHVESSGETRNGLNIDTIQQV